MVTTLFVINIVKWVAISHFVVKFNTSLLEKERNTVHVVKKASDLK